MFKKKYLLLTLFLIIILQTILYTNNNQKTSFRYFKWTLQEVSIGKLISISFFSGLFLSSLLNTTIASTSFRKKTFENVEDDFGSQYSELIARRIRETNVFSLVVSNYISIEEIKNINPKGIILSGGPNSVYDHNAPKCDEKIFNLGIPILGIC